VGELADVVLRVLELAAPEEGVVWTDLDADAAVHAERVIDREAVQDIALAGPASLALGRERLLVRVDVDAPVGALAPAQHAHRAVLLLEGDHAARAGREVLLLVRVLDHGVVLEEVLERHPEPLEQPDPVGPASLLAELVRLKRHSFLTRR